MEAPICLIENTADDKLVVNPKAINILSKFNQPMVVVSIVGMYRTGKSYLMNKLSGSQRGFDVGSTVRAQTKGIWIWCVPHPTKTNHTLVLLDTEGLGDIEKGDGKSDIRIFALAVLLSSALVYNSKGTIDQDAMNKLKFVGEISELIKIKSEDNEDEEVEISSHFPIFIWAVRDFHLELNLDGQLISEDDYLENALKLKNPEKTTKDEDYNRLRKRIRAYFGTRKCFIFGLPAANDGVLGNLEKAPESKLSERFVAQSRRFCDYIFQNVGAKHVRDMLTVTGHRFGELAKMYTEAITNSKFACIEEAVVSLAEKENQAAIQEATKHYVEKMKTIQLPTKTLANFLEQSRRYEEEARQMFLKRSFKDNNHVFLEQFMRNLLKEKNGFICINEEKSLEICNSLIKKHSLTFEKALAGGAYNVRGGHAKFKQHLKAIEEKYNMEKGKGVKADEALKQYIESKQSTEISIIQQDNALNMKEKEAAEENNRRKIYEMEQNFRRQLEQQTNQMKAENKVVVEQTISEMIRHMEMERRVMNENMERTIREKAKEQELYLKQGLQEQANKYQAHMETLQRENQDAEKSLENCQEMIGNLEDKCEELSNRWSCTIS
ncbi:guanylate-binding protein 6-like isoform X1 [Aquarana catesbeiana]|uniref:guanylate-binding protein 6-like isoform X1 n=1 Tax=Aquarana catesbeiana TaxID=8400 RepID=UPI003CC940C0